MPKCVLTYDYITLIWRYVSNMYKFLHRTLHQYFLQHHSPIFACHNVVLHPGAITFIIAKLMITKKFGCNKFN